MKLAISGAKGFEGLTSEITINEMNNEDEDEHFQFEYNSSDSKSSSKKFPMIQNFKACKDEIEKDIRNIFQSIKENLSKKN